MRGTIDVVVRTRISYVVNGDIGSFEELKLTFMGDDNIPKSTVLLTNEYLSQHRLLGLISSEIKIMRGE